MTIDLPTVDDGYQIILLLVRPDGTYTSVCTALRADYVEAHQREREWWIQQGTCAGRTMHTSVTHTPKSSAANRAAQPQANQPPEGSA